MRSEWVMQYCKGEDALGHGGGGALLVLSLNPHNIPERERWPQLFRLLLISLYYRQ